MDYYIVEKDNPHAVHCITWSRKRAEHWIKTFPLHFLDNKSLTRKSFTIQERAAS